jgi:tRNA(Ile)-lysidine synthase
MLLQPFQDFIKKNQLFSPEDKVLIAVSGGIDSVCLCRLFHESSYSFAIAHCNFGLRGKESDDDQSFVEKLAKKYNVPFFVKKFNTIEFAAQNKLSTQMAARELRYEWFNELCLENDFKHIAIAHHLNDSIETIFLNLLRGTGIAGLSGIKEKNEKIIRPLLFATREEIENFANERNLEWREDSSNASSDYTRNELRNSIIPLFKKINPTFEETMNKNIKRFRQAEMIYSNSINNLKNEVLVKRNDDILINTEKLFLSPFMPTLLYEILKDYNFNEQVVNDIRSGLKGQPGKQFFSSTHCLTRDREYLIINPIMKPVSEVFYINREDREIKKPIHLVFKVEKKGSERSQDSASLDLTRLRFPLQLRKWKKGDSFQPSGMKGKKKLSNFFIDKKLTLPEKENTWVLLSDNKIIWIAGLRVDERFKADENTKEYYTIFLREKS